MSTVQIVMYAGGALSVVNRRLGRPGVEVHVGCARVRMSYGFR